VKIDKHRLSVGAARCTEDQGRHDSLAVRRRSTHLRIFDIVSIFFVRCIEVFNDFMYIVDRATKLSATTFATSR
jgi:hypothetical protein